MNYLLIKKLERMITMMTIQTVSYLQKYCLLRLPYKLLHLMSATFLISLFATHSWAADEHPVLKYKINLPPSAELHYAIKAQQSGLSIDGEGIAKWDNNSNHTYHVTAETRAMLFGKILETSSEGNIDSFGLAPTSFVEKRLRHDTSTTTFNREQNAITFSQSDQKFPLLGGEQDRTSIIWQLIAIARGNPEKFSKGSEWKFFVAGPRDAEQWVFKVIGLEKIKTAIGDLPTVHLFRNPPPGDTSQQLDIWLAPSKNWFPARLRFSDPGKDYIDQTLQSLNLK